MKMWLVISIFIFLGLYNLCNANDITKAEAEKTAQEFFSLVTTGNSQEAYNMLSSEMQGMITAEQIGQIWEKMQGQLGKYEKIVDSNYTVIEGHHLFIYTCKFNENYFDCRISVDSAREISGFYIMPNQSRVKYVPPDYVVPDSFFEEDISISYKGWTLPGIITIPNGKGPFPAVILVHGSGPNDKDETIGPNKPFKDLAWGLATRGIAVLRYDKRTKVYAEKIAKELKNFTVNDETIYDAVEAVQVLKTVGKIDNKRIFVLGHSLGGYVMPRIAEKAADAAGFIIMAGCARPLEDIMLEQIVYILSADGDISDVEEQKIQEIRGDITKIKSPELSVSDSTVMNAPTSYWLDMKGYKPAQMMKNINKPILILQGERDYQVTMEDYDIWKENLADMKNVDFKLYPQLNHLFIEGTGKCVPAEYNIPGHVAPYVIEDISKWILRK